MGFFIIRRYIAQGWECWSKEHTHLRWASLVHYSDIRFRRTSRCGFQWILWSARSARRNFRV